MMRSPRIVAVADFSRDMVDTVAEYFEAYAVAGVVSIEVGDDGTLWLPNPRFGGRQFLGLAKLPPDVKVY